MSEILILVLIAVTSAGIGAIIGQKKNRPGAGIFWGFLLGPIGWVIVLLGPHAGFIKCPHCGGEIPHRQATCAHCNKPVTWSKDGRTAFRPSVPVR